MKDWKTTLGGALLALGLYFDHSPWGKIAAILGALFQGHSAADKQSTDAAPPSKFTLPCFLLIAAALICLLTGCARFHSEQVQVKADGTRIESHQDLTTFLASKATVAKLRASTTDKTQGLSVGSIDSESDASNLVGAAIKAALEAAPK